MTTLGFLWSDIRLAARTLTKGGAFVLIAALSLALGIGSCIVVFTVSDNLLFRAFNTRNSSRLAVPLMYSPNVSKQSGLTGGDPRFGYANYLTIRDQNHVFEDVVGYNNQEFLYSYGRETRQVRGALVTSNSFAFYGSPSLLGRGIDRADGELGAPPVFVISYDVWKAELNSDQSVVGKSFLVNGEPRTLIGVMPSGFHPYGGRLWVPIARTGTPSNGDIAVYILARLKPGVSLETARAELDVLFKQISRARPDDLPEDASARIQSAVDYAMGPFGLNMSKRVLYALFAAVGILLLIACANVANLLLARSSSRRKEIAIRLALGTSTWRLLQQLLVESFGLSLVACVFGCFLAYLGLKGLAGMMPQKGIALEAGIGFNVPAFGFAILMTCFTALFCGVFPALNALRRELISGMAGAGKGAAEDSKPGRVRSTLVVCQVALSIILLVAASLSLRTLAGIMNIDLGFSPRNTIIVRVSKLGGKPSTPQQDEEFYRRVLPRLLELPGVANAAATMALPGYGGPGTGVEVAGKLQNESWFIKYDLCNERLLTTLGLRLRKGRFLSQEDVSSARQYAVVNETLVRTFFEQENPIGQKIRFNSLDRDPQAPHAAYFEIVGVVSDAKNFGPRAPVMPMAYIPFTITGLPSRAILIKTVVDPRTLVQTVKRAVWSASPDVFLDAATLESTYEKLSYAEPEFGFATLGALAAVALLLVTAGIFSVMGYTVSLQKHDIGIRMVLGAQANEIRRMVYGRGLRLIIVGAVIGILISFIMGRIVAARIWEAPPNDPLTLVSVILVVLVSGALACWFPARIATRVDPISILRSE